MKPIFGIDITRNKKNEQLNGTEFIIATVSQARSESFDSTSENAKSVVEKSKLPLPLRIIEWICGVVGGVMLIGILKADVSLAQGYRNAPWAFWMAGICLVVWLILHLLARKKAKTVLEGSEAKAALSSLETVANDIYQELGVPEDASDVDVLMFRYKMKDREPIAGDYLNLEMKLFVKDGKLCLADLENTYAFPVESLRGIRTVSKRISVPFWNKEVGPKAGIYKPYKMTTNDAGSVFFKPYHVLELVQNGTAMGIYFPCYELPVFESLTGLQAKEKE